MNQLLCRILLLALALSLLLTNRVDKPSQSSIPVCNPARTALARLTVYWSGGGTGADYWSRRKMSSSGVVLKPGACAVDPKVIQYGSKITIPGIGTFTAVDTGTDVRNRTAARLSGKTPEEQQALVIDIFFEDKAEALAFARKTPHFAQVEWTVGEIGRSL